MKLPLALQTALQRSEKEFLATLFRLGLTRDGLVRAADRIRSRTKNPPPARPAAYPARRVTHV